MKSSLFQKTCMVYISLVWEVLILRISILLVSRHRNYSMDRYKLMTQIIKRKVVGPDKSILWVMNNMNHQEMDLPIRTPTFYVLSRKEWNKIAWHSAKYFLIELEIYCIEKSKMHFEDRIFPEKWRCSLQNSRSSHWSEL